MELLKLRFGDSAMHLCDVMLKDLADSKRVDTNIKARRPEGTMRAQ